jgi:protein SCO1/2
MPLHPQQYALFFVIAFLISSYPITSFSEETTIGGDFELTSHYNEPYSLENARGKVVVLFFGFTLCPDVCPNTLSTIQTVLDQLGEKAKQIQPIFITVDPKRDTPEVLKNYLQYFNNDYIGLTGNIKSIDEVVKQFQGFYSYMGNVSEDQYMVDHTSNLYIINQDGKVTNVMQYGLPPQAITNVIEKLL